MKQKPTKKPKKQALSPRKLKLTAIVGYMLFAATGAMAAYSLFSAVQFFMSAEARMQQSAYWFFITLFVAELLPWLTGIIAGESSAKKHSRLERHYNGVLLGMITYFLWTSLSMIHTFAISDRLNLTEESQWIAYWPLYFAMVASGLVGLLYYRQKRKTPLLAFRPFQVLAALAAAAFVGSFLVMPPSHFTTGDISFTILLILPVVLFLAGLLITYRASNERSSVLARFADATLGIAFLYGIVSVIAMPLQFMPPLDSMLVTTLSIACLLLGFVLWLIFLWQANKR